MEWNNRKLVTTNYRMSNPRIYFSLFNFHWQ